MNTHIKDKNRLIIVISDTKVNFKSKIIIHELFINPFYRIFCVSYVRLYLKYSYEFILTRDSDNSHWLPWTIVEDNDSHFIIS